MNELYLQQFYGGADYYGGIIRNDIYYLRSYHENQKTKDDKNGDEAAWVRDLSFFFPFFPWLSLVFSSTTILERAETWLFLLILLFMNWSACYYIFKPLSLLSKPSCIAFIFPFTHSQLSRNTIQAIFFF